MKKQQTKTKSRIRLNEFGSLFFRTYMSFAGIILFFAVLLGALYMNMYNKTVSDSNIANLVAKARSIAQRCGVYHLDWCAMEQVERYDDADVVARGWVSYVLMLKDVEKNDIIAVANPNAGHPLSHDMAVNFNSSVINDDQRELAAAVFEYRDGHSKTAYLPGYSEEYQCNVLTVAEPVLGVGGEIAGAILLYSKLTTEQEVITQTFQMIILSVVISLLISFGITIPIVGAITRPISVINNTALKLARGNYSVRTKISKKDEVGELAKSVDHLALELKKADDERKNSEQLRLDFFANVSHELRTPITVVRAYTESLADGMVDEPEKVKQYYDRMLAECDSMQRLVGDLLTLSKMQNPDFVIDKETVNLQQVFNDIYRSAKQLASGKNIQVVLDMIEEPCMMMADYMRLRQMFMVIIDNAIKFSPENGTVTIKLFYDDKINVQISDEGVGISEEELPYIFEKFYRSKLRANATGSGLGLPIAKYICNKHDGTIRVASEKGKGTTFFFTFPAEVKIGKPINE